MQLKVYLVQNLPACYALFHHSWKERPDCKEQSCNLCPAEIQAGSSAKQEGATVYSKWIGFLLMESQRDSKKALAGLSSSER